MKMTLSSALALTALALVASPASAQSAGTISAKIGYNQIIPQVRSGDLSAPSFPGTKIDLEEAVAPIFTLLDMVTGSFFAEATMVDPLAVSTGLEFQGIDHVYTAAAHTPDGCVESWLGSRVFAEVSFPK